MAVKIIKASKTGNNNTSVPEQAEQKLRVAAYCRVSSDSQDQLTSYEAQVQHYTDVIRANPLWTLAGIFADEGISGTGLRRRDQFNKMLEACEDHMIDLVLTKSVSRWSRNTIDSLNTIRRLKELGIGIIFEKESIHTLESSGELLITIMSSIAQQESDSISRNIKIGIQYNYQQGKGRLNTKQFLGYDKDPKDRYQLVINPDQAETVRRIYRLYLEGYSTNKIAAILMAEGIPTPAGKSTWYQSTVISILENEKYCGDLLLQKYYVTDFLTHKIARNEGELPQYFVENHHPPIVPKEIYYQVQGEIQRRSLNRYNPRKIRFGNSNAFTGRLVCGHCGRTLKRIIHPDPKFTDWRCRQRKYTKQSVTKENQAACPCRNVLESEAQEMIVRAFNCLPGMKEELIRRQGALWDGEIRRMDLMLERLKEQERRIAERLDELGSLSDEDGTVSGSIDPGFDTVSDFTDPDSDSVSIEGAAVNHTVDAGGTGAADNCAVDADGTDVDDNHTVHNPDEMAFLQSELTRLEQEETELLLERAEAANTEMKIRLLLELIDTMTKRVDTVEHYNSPACYDYDEFFKRTRYVIDEGILDSDGSLMRFQNDLVIRYLDQVIVNDGDYEVKLKAGISMTVPFETKVAGVKTV